MYKVDTTILNCYCYYYYYYNFAGLQEETGRGAINCTPWDCFVWSGMQSFFLFPMNITWALIFTRGKGSVLVGGRGCIFIHSCSVQLISFEVKAEPEYALPQLTL